MATESDQSELGKVNEPAPIPEWWLVYEGLSEQEIAEIEEVILQRAKLTRPSPTLEEWSAAIAIDVATDAPMEAKPCSRSIKSPND